MSQPIRVACTRDSLEMLVLWSVQLREMVNIVALCSWSLSGGASPSIQGGWCWGTLCGPCVLANERWLDVRVTVASSFQLFVSSGVCRSGAPASAGHWRVRPAALGRSMG